MCIHKSDITQCYTQTAEFEFDNTFGQCPNKISHQFLQFLFWLILQIALQLSLACAQAQLSFMRKAFLNTYHTGFNMLAT